MIVNSIFKRNIFTMLYTYSYQWQNVLHNNFKHKQCIGSNFVQFRHIAGQLLSSPLPKVTRLLREELCREHRTPILDVREHYFVQRNIITNYQCLVWVSPITTLLTQNISTTLKTPIIDVRINWFGVIIKIA